MNLKPLFAMLAAGAMAAGFSLPAIAEDSQAELAKKSLNPVADLISVPLKLDYDHNIGPLEHGNRYQFTAQPVIPISISTDWNLISRTLVPVIHLKDATPVSGKQFAVGDITPQFFFSPKAPTAGGWIWGIGPQALLRTGGDHLSSEKWGLGPTGVVLRQEHGWTYGVLANHMWSVAGSNEARSISASYVQPFLTYTTPRYTTFGINSESTYDWKTEKWSAPVNAFVQQMLKVGDQHLIIQGGVRHWIASPDGIGPKGWGARVQLTFLFPK